MAYLYSGRIIRAGKAWTDNDGIQHPSNWMVWDDATKTAKGLVWEDDAASFDGRFYWSAGVAKALDDVNEVDENGDPLMQDGEQVVTLGLKSNAIALVKAQAGGLLAPTDWMVIKASEVADYSVDADNACHIVPQYAQPAIISRQPSQRLVIWLDLWHYMMTYR
jgi:hypothetical protein